MADVASLTEVTLGAGGPTSPVRVGATVHRPAGPHTPAIQELLRHLGRVGFEGAPRALGVDEAGRDVREFVEGQVPRPPLQPWMAADDALEGLALLLRRYHDAVAGFVPPADARWQLWVGAPGRGDTICHYDLYPPNVVFRDRRPFALIDWEWAQPAPRLFDVASAVSKWTPLADDAHREKWGFTGDRRTRLRLFCDVYGLSRAERGELIDTVLWRNRISYDTHLAWSAAGVGSFAHSWANGLGAKLLRTRRWIEDNRLTLERALR
jgi:Ser/Thr protein kinase RdoA (MazF antagonist)